MQKIAKFLITGKKEKIFFLKPQVRWDTCDFIYHYYYYLILLIYIFITFKDYLNLYYYDFVQKFYKGTVVFIISKLKQ